MMQLKRIGEPTVSPDGKWVGFAAVDVNLEEYAQAAPVDCSPGCHPTSANSALVGPGAGGEARRLTPAGGKGEDRIRFAPDGKRILFESSRDGGSQIWAQDFDTSTGTLTGEPRKVTSISTEASGGLWSPDGKSILFVSSVYPDCKDDACNKQRDDEQRQVEGEGQHLHPTYVPPLEPLLRRQVQPPVSSSLPMAASPRDLTPGAHDVPPFSASEGRTSTRSRPTARRSPTPATIDQVQATSTNNDVFIVPAAGGEAKQITTNPGSDGTPMYSPDGKYIAYRSQFRGGYESDRFRLMLYERATGKITDLTPNFDRWVDSIVWSPDSKTIYFTAENEGENPIYQINVTAPNAWPQELVDGFNDSPMPTPDGKTLVFDQMSIAAPERNLCRAIAVPAVPYSRPARKPISIRTA